MTEPNKPKQEPVDFWDWDDGTDTLTHTEQDDAIQAYFDSSIPSEWSAELEVFGFAKTEPGDKDKDWLAARIAENFLEHLSAAELGNIGDGDEPTKELVAVARTFVDAALVEYKGRVCKQVTSETVNTVKWVRENYSVDELAEPEVAAALKRLEDGDGESAEGQETNIV